MAELSWGGLGPRLGWVADLVVDWVADLVAGGLFGGLDNLLGVADVSTANSIAFNFGFNIVID